MKTAIGFYITSDAGLTTNEMVEKIHGLRDYLVGLHGTFKWHIKDLKQPDAHCKSVDLDNEWITDVSGFIEAFNDFAEYIRNNGEDEDSFCVVTDPSKRYERSEDIDIEEGAFDFDRSFDIDLYQFRILVGTDALYASEIGLLPSAGLDIQCDMNDIDGDYFEFYI